MNWRQLSCRAIGLTFVSAYFLIFPLGVAAADQCIKDNSQATSGKTCQQVAGTPQACCDKCTCADIKDASGTTTGYRCDACPLTTTVTPPKPQVPFPGFSGFTDQVDLDTSKTFYTIPWIAQYISALYKFGVGVAMVLAVAMIVFGGFVWMTAGGNANQVTTAKGYIIGAISGVVLALGSYSILYLVNPNLTKLSPIIVPSIEKQDLEIDQEIDLQNPTAAGIEAGAASILQSQNPYQSVCTKYPGGKYDETIALECKKLGDTPSSSIVKTKFGGYADAKAYQNVLQAIECVRTKHGDAIANGLSFNSGWRAPATQYSTWKTARAGYAAKPCCSNHGSGMAFDMRYQGATIKDWQFSDTYLKDCFGQFGLKASLRTSPSEPWHYSPTGH